MQARADPSIRRNDEMQLEYADCRKVRELLGWHARISLDEGLALTLKSEHVQK